MTNTKEKMADTIQMPKVSRISLLKILTSERFIDFYLFFVWVLCIHLLLPGPHGEKPFDVPKEGEITRRSYIAPFTFDLLKTAEEINKERNEAEKRIPFLLRYDYEITEKVMARFHLFERHIAKLKDGSLPDSIKTAIYRSIRKELSEDAISLFMDTDLSPLMFTEIAARIMNHGIVSEFLMRDQRLLKEYVAKYNVEPSSSRFVDNEIISLIRDGRETIIGEGDILTKEAAIEKERPALRQFIPKERLGAAYEILYAWTAPNIFVFEDEMQKRKTAVRDSVKSTRGKVVKDLEIVGRNKLVTPEIARSLYSLKVAQDRIVSTHNKNLMWTSLMRFIAIVLSLLPFYIWVREKIGRKDEIRSMGAFVTLTLLQSVLMVGLWHLANSVLVPMDSSSHYDFMYLYPLAFAPILASVLFSTEIGVVAALLSSVLLSIMVGFDFSAALVHFVAASAAAIGLHKIKYRSQFFFSFALYAAVSLIAVAAVVSLKQGRFDGITIARHTSLMLIAGLFSLMLSITLVWVFERLFSVMTNLTLIELSDMNIPALKRLSLEAPGTYHHSVLVGNLTEAAAEKVGGNPLLGRVMAYYHDLGKVYKPEYFIENSQNFVDNLHGKVSPRMSAIIIAAHVKQGAELAKKYRLPQKIQEAIREHHGTTLISFFYDKEKENDPNKQIVREDFCYPGPKPRTKETAILMLADSVEAASRTLENPTSSRLRNLVDGIVTAKVQDGQMNDSELTLKELELVRESFVTVLTAMFHSRIEYPEQERASAT